MRGLLHAACAVSALFLAAVATADEPVPESIVSPASVGEVVFPHRAHVDDYGFDCVECHHETRAAALATPHPGYLEDSGVDCAVCHGQSTPLAARTCSACHGSSIETVASDSLSAKVAIHRTCWKCHEPATGAEASAGCALCHARPEHAAAPAAARGR
jgi:c(7)-type cytochrome triheme protein